MYVGLLLKSAVMVFAVCAVANAPFFQAAWRPGVAVTVKLAVSFWTRTAALSKSTSALLKKQRSLPLARRSRLIEPSSQLNCPNRTSRQGARDGVTANSTEKSRVAVTPESAMPSATGFSSASFCQPFSAQVTLDPSVPS